MNKILVDKDCFEYFNVCYNNWHIDSGRYELILANSATSYLSIFKIKI